jgi:Fe2+ transport system protein FeoA
MFFGKRRKRRRGHRHGHRGIGLAGKCLSDLRPGQRCKILRVGGRGRARRRFMEMGLVRGETVLVERLAPLGDPIEFFVKGYHVSLRRDDAQHIEVQILREDPGGDA